MGDFLRRILYPTFVAMIIATVWAMGHAQATEDRAYERRNWPAADPQMYHLADEAGTVGDDLDSFALIDDE